MIRAERFNLITNLSNEKDVITLEELAERLNVSVATVRRDVEELCAQGIVDKTRGGIIFRNKKQDTEPSLQLRSYFNLEEKKRIAQAALRYVEPNSYYMFDSGSTVGQLIRLIPRDFPVSIVTYDLNYITDLNAHEKCRRLHSRRQAPPGTDGLPRPQRRTVAGSDDAGNCLHRR